jgi:hypothetical protein
MKKKKRTESNSPSKGVLDPVTAGLVDPADDVPRPKASDRAGNGEARPVELELSRRNESRCLFSLSRFLSVLLELRSRNRVVASILTGDMDTCDCDWAALDDDGEEKLNEASV